MKIIFNKNSNGLAVLEIKENKLRVKTNKESFKKHIKNIKQRNKLIYMIDQLPRKFNHAYGYIDDVNVKYDKLIQYINKHMLELLLENDVKIII